MIIYPINMKTNMKTDHIGRDRKPEPNLKKLKKKNSSKFSNLKAFIPYSLSHSDFEKTENERL